MLLTQPSQVELRVAASALKAHCELQPGASIHPVGFLQLRRMRG
jgi:hypothetical protein